MTARIPGEQRKTILFDGESLMLIYSSKMFVTNLEVKNSTRLARSAFSCLRPCLWSRQSLPGSGEFDSAIRLQDMASTSSR